jgi:hypothetical protein
MDSPTNPAPIKFNIILKPGVLDSQLLPKKPKKRSANPIPDAITLFNPAPGENKFTGKLRNVLDALTFAVQDYIIHNLDNEATSQTYKTRLQTGLGRIRDDFINNRCSGHPTNNPAI